MSDIIQHVFEGPIILNSQIALIKCPHCRGSGFLITLPEQGSSFDDPCSTCKGVGLTRVHIDKIPFFEGGLPDEPTEF